MLFDKEITQKLAPEDRIKVWPDLQSKSEIGIISKKILDNMNKKSHKAQKQTSGRVHQTPLKGLYVEA